MITICGDAGHGGKDSGAVGFGTEEADITLPVLLLFGEACKRQGWKFVPTRTGDTYPTLAQRCAIANNAGADRFVSFHFDCADGNPSARGISVLCYPSSASRALAAKIFRLIETLTPYADRGVIDRPELAVLNGTSMPAALVEGGFITNSTEHAMMLSHTYQVNLAEKTCQAVALDFGVAYKPPIPVTPPAPVDDTPRLFVASIRPSKAPRLKAAADGLAVTSHLSDAKIRAAAAPEVAKRLEPAAEAGAAAFNAAAV
jgi:N-acetylmuramoyl-L-alanine amidase